MNNKNYVFKKTDSEFALEQKVIEMDNEVNHLTNIIVIGFFILYFIIFLFNIYKHI